jgi:hypothetical protein
MPLVPALIDASVPTAAALVASARPLSITDTRIGSVPAAALRARSRLLHGRSPPSSITPRLRGYAASEAITPP